MSSFVYHKKYFMEAAGYLAGIAAENDRFPWNLLWLYNYETGKLFTDSDFEKLFSTLYFINAESVRRQYNDAEREEDPENYNEIFQAAKQAAHKHILSYYCGGSNDFKMTLFKMCDFFSGILYQIEDPELSFIAAYTLNDIRAKIVGLIARFSGIDSDDISGWSGLQVTSYTKRAEV